MYDVGVGVVHVISLVSGDHTKVSHQAKLTSKRETVLLMEAANRDVTMCPSVMEPLSINIWIIAAAKFREHLGSG